MAFHLIYAEIFLDQYCGFRRNVVILGAYITSSLHADNQKKLISLVKILQKC